MATAIYYTDTDTPEGVKAEFVDDLRKRAERAKASATTCRSARDKARYTAEAAALDAAAGYWSEVRIGHPGPLSAAPAEG